MACKKQKISRNLAQLEEDFAVDVVQEASSKRRLSRSASPSKKQKTSHRQEPGDDTSSNSTTCTTCGSANELAQPHGYHGPFAGPPTPPDIRWGLTVAKKLRLERRHGGRVPCRWYKLSQNIVGRCLGRYRDYVGPWVWSYWDSEVIVSKPWPLRAIREVSDEDPDL
mgnify:CR=1 FL=1